MYYITKTKKYNTMKFNYINVLISREDTYSCHQRVIKALRARIHIYNNKNGKIRSLTYSMDKETKTGAWMLRVPDVFVTYLSRAQYTSFLEKNISSKYLFDIYYDSNNSCYVVICVSHYYHQLDARQFMTANSCNTHYMRLSEVLKSFVILNPHFKCKSEKLIVHTPLSPFTLHSVIGRGKCISELKSVSVFIAVFVRNSKHLPEHYLNIN